MLVDSIEKWVNSIENWVKYGCGGDAAGGREIDEKKFVILRPKTSI